LYYRDTNEDFDSELEEEDEDEEDELEKDEKERHYDEREDNFEQESIQYQNRKGGAHNSPKQVFRKYKGAVVLEPKRGLHQDAHLFDVTSLYPTIITNKIQKVWVGS
jgi:hypothetical protein